MIEIICEDTKASYFFWKNSLERISNCKVTASDGYTNIRIKLTEISKEKELKPSDKIFIFKIIIGR